MQWSRLVRPCAPYALRSAFNRSWGVPQDRLPATLPQEPGNVVLASLENILWWNGVLFFSMAPLLNMRLYGGTMQGYLQAWGISDVPYLDPIAIAIQGICLGQAWSVHPSL